MGKEMRELHKVHKLAIEKAKEEVRTNSKLDLDNGEIYSVETGETIGEI